MYIYIYINQWLAFERGHKCMICQLILIDFGMPCCGYKGYLVDEYGSIHIVVYAENDSLCTEQTLPSFEPNSLWKSDIMKNKYVCT